MDATLAAVGARRLHDTGRSGWWQLFVLAPFGFLVVLTGEIMRMPGLPRKPLAQSVKFLPDGSIQGIG